MIFKKLIPHICIILGLVSLTLLILVQFNPVIMSIGFFYIAMYAFCGIAIIVSGMLIAFQRKE